MTEERKGITLRQGDALIVVDVQSDFLPGGALAVPEGDAVIAPLNNAIANFAAKGLPIFFSRDWHPPDHCSFSCRGGPWPPHCVQGSPGAAFAPGLHVPPPATVIAKGTDPQREEYSAIAGRNEEGHTLGELLQQGGIRRVFVGGLATEYCVLNTVRDLASLGVALFVLADAVRAVELKLGDGAAALQGMASLGAAMITTEMLAP